MSRKQGKDYHYSFAELCDRLMVCQLKEIHSEKPNPAFAEEIKQIVGDIQLHLEEIPMTSEQIRAFVVLCFANQFIWNNEDTVRAKFTSDTNREYLLDQLIATHKMNSVRGIAKLKIQQARKSRQDPKLNYGSAEQNNIWNITW